MKSKWNSDWPVLTTYDADHLAHVAMPIGGIGTGCVSLGGRGDLRDWEIANRPSKKFTPEGSFFALRAEARGRPAVTRALEGPVEAENYESGRGCPVPNHGLPRFRHATFGCAYPLGQVLLQDRDVPLDVRIEAFNPLVPADADASGLPVAVFRFVLANPSRTPVKTSVVGSLCNFIGSDGSNPLTVQMDYTHLTAGSKKNRNRFKSAGGVRGLFMDSPGVARDAEQWGTMAMVTTASSGVTHCAGRPILRHFWEAFAETGRLTPKRCSGDAPIGALAASTTVPAGGSRTLTFLITWHFPNRMDWNAKRRVGNYYTTQSRDAWAVATKAAAGLRRLERDTVRFVRAFCDSDLPAEAKEAALYNLSTLNTQTCFRTEDGRLFGWEGCCEFTGCCAGSCTHVWNYEQATGFLFGGLSWTMREVEFASSTRKTGFMNFRCALPLKTGDEWGVAAADGQMGALMRLYRDWTLSGDDAALRKLWQRARKAMEFAWLDKGWDPNRDGVMEGAQHHTLDSEYFGPNPLTGVWYLGALRACEEMARHLGQDDFADTCRRVFENGSRRLDEELFNGEYYEHHIIPAKKPDNVLPGLIWNAGRGDLAKPGQQLGKGCLVDQLVGQYMAHICGLGYLLKRRNVRKTYASIMKHNFRTHFFDHLNPSRGFALNDDSGLLMCTYPHGGAPEHTIGPYTECMTGFEYSTAIGMLQEGQTAAGLKCIRAVRDRYDGRTRNPFNEAECGHHYARAMASWGAVVALTGFHYSAVTGTMQFATSRKPATWFWSNGYAWGTVEQKPGARSRHVRLTVLHGELPLNELVLAGMEPIRFARPRRLHAGRTLELTLANGVRRQSS